ncbi:MAG: hypothetical protein FJ312_03375 [SAR202 cluster bacterium]|nr:hypothetical protein [SAR202 cluster bacterium]
MQSNHLGKFFVWLLPVAVVLTALALAACSKSAEPTPAPTAARQATHVLQATQAPEEAETPLPLPTEPTAQEQAATSTPEPEAEVEVNPTFTPTPAAIPSPAATNTPTPVPPTPTAKPAAAPTPRPSATPTPTPLGEFTLVDGFGFTLRIDGQADVQSAGWSESEPSESQGQVQFQYSGVTAILIWLPAVDYTPQTLLEEAYATLQATRPSITFTAVSEADIQVSGQTGRFGGFSASSGDTVVGGGLIGTWLCPSADTAYVLTVTGVDSVTVQIRFQRLLANFECAP